jgi:hypothetical protein
MRHFALFALLLLAGTARADFSQTLAPAPQLVSVAESSTTTAANTSEQTLIELTNLAPTNFLSVQMDMTAASTFTIMNFKVYRKRGAGNYILLGTSSNLTGILAWTLATSSKGFEVLTANVFCASGDSFKVTGTQTISGAAFAIPYTVVGMR